MGGLLRELLADRELVAVLGTTVLTAIELSCLCVGFAVWLFAFGGVAHVKLLWAESQNKFLEGDEEEEQGTARIERRAEARAVALLSKEERQNPTNVAVLKVIASKAMHDALSDHQQTLREAEARRPSLLAWLRAWWTPHPDQLYATEVMKHV